MDTLSISVSVILLIQASYYLMESSISASTMPLLLKVIEFVQTVAIASADPDCVNGVGNMISVKAITLSEVVVKARPLKPLSEVAICEADIDVVTDRLFGETRVVTGPGHRTESVEAEAAARAFSDI